MQLIFSGNFDIFPRFEHNLKFAFGWTGHHEIGDQTEEFLLLLQAVNFFFNQYDPQFSKCLWKQVQRSGFFLQMGQFWTTHSATSNLVVDIKSMSKIKPI